MRWLFRFLSWLFYPKCDNCGRCGPGQVRFNIHGPYICFRCSPPITWKGWIN